MGALLMTDSGPNLEELRALIAEGKELLKEVERYENLEVQCGIHGPMKLRFKLDLWECVGYDGEGCCTVTIETMVKMLQGQPVDASDIFPWVHYTPMPLSGYDHDLIIVKFKGSHLEFADTAADRWRKVQGRYTIK